MKIEGRFYETLDFFKMQRYFMEEGITEDFSSFESDFLFYSLYYNKNNFTEEPFIERIPLRITMK